ncbi:MAG: tyrosine--tRNA ligase [Actinomycetota bacterium]
MPPKSDAAEQFRLLSSGAEIIPQAEFRSKLERSVAGGTPLRVKLGIDPSSPDIHIGHAVVLRKLRRFQQLGHTAVLIIGDFTGMVGDPTGRSETRNALTAEEVRANAQTYVEQVRRILLPEPLEVVWNSEWLGALGTEGLLRLASQMTVARMLERDDFAKRYAAGKPISIIEFCYPLLQGYDSVAVRSDVELGGTDQTFNLLVGRDLQQRAGLQPQVALVTPLLEGLDGEQKMSKSLGNYVGVTDAPEDMFGKLMSVPDRLLGKYLRLATDLDPAEVDALESSASGGGKAAADAKRRLAREVTAIYHGADAGAGAEARFDRVYRERAMPEQIAEVQIPATGDRIMLANLIVELGILPSTSEARRMMKQGGVRLNDQPLTDPNAAGTPNELRGKVLRVGKHHFVRLT